MITEEMSEKFSKELQLFILSKFPEPMSLDDMGVILSALERAKAAAIQVLKSRGLDVKMFEVHDGKQ